MSRQLCGMAVKLVAISSAKANVSQETQAFGVIKIN